MLAVQIRVQASLAVSRFICIRGRLLDEKLAREHDEGDVHNV